MSDRSDVYGVQTFLKDRKGHLCQGSTFECRDADEARRMAEQRVQRGAVVGSAAFLRRDFSKEFDDGSEPITLATYGRVPPGVADALPF
ncbi:hypothetical protein [Methylobacterium gnaphalii]|uniref:Uncharacterized protein n=1 Tax=Methylobacterium gnaphalii TaxID=1010610 RepID=A0A512JIV2_9HYPH|nr:hypothetical protein [Methylobacterium gnaphalii]GEP09864.1 hypothetical protein MGN01_17090 [Methylobacterium gnaphalii]GJD67221.1 hypothetical protein MMMDOFMJ_0135 [Methylobacterium gnaphalii]GLS49893.1 hypothetical protein GCM10007885_27450 [Methylobacterium gnaphalii]